MQHRVVLTIELGKLAGNYRAVCGVAAPCAVMPVLKANAYGLGVDPIAKALVAAGAPRIAVAEPFEALALADLGVPIQILSGILPDEIGPMIEAGVTLPLVSLESARAISDEAVRQGRTAICHLALDTGMGRAGFLWDRAPALLPDLLALPNLNIEGLPPSPKSNSAASALSSMPLRPSATVSAGCTPPTPMPSTTPPPPALPPSTSSAAASTSMVPSTPPGPSASLCAPSSP